MSTLNLSQLILKVMDRLKELLWQDQNILLHGAGGFGKSHLIRELVTSGNGTFLSKKGEKRIVVVALTGVAALGVSSPGYPATTLHRWAGVGLARESAPELVKKLLASARYANSKKGGTMDVNDPTKSWKETDILVIDEISMLGIDLFEKLEFIARAIRGSKKPFGGIKIIASGDFLQLPPINDGWVFESERWSQLSFQPLILETPYRFTDPQFLECLMSVRKGRVSKEQIAMFMSRVLPRGPQPSEVKAMIISTTANYMKKFQNPYLLFCFGIKANEEYSLPPDMRKYIWDVMTKNDQPKGERILPTVLYPKRRDVSGYNLQKLSEIKSKEEHFDAQDFLCRRKKKKDGKEERITIDSDFISDNPKLAESFFRLLDEAIPARISLKKGAQVMLKANLDFSRELVNGSRGVVESFDPDGPVVRFVNGQTQKITPKLWEYAYGEALLLREQIPLVLAWACTCHSTQGSTLDYVIANLGNDVFECGQSYVALSRARCFDGLFLEAFSHKEVKANPQALKYVEKIEKEYESQMANFFDQELYRTIFSRVIDSLPTRKK